MHGHVPYEQFLDNISVFLGTYYLFMALMNGLVALYIWQSGKDCQLFRLPIFNVPVTASIGWLLVAMLFVFMSPIAYSGHPGWMQSISIPASIRIGLTKILNPTVYTLASLGLFAGLYVGRAFFSKPLVAYIGLNLSMLVMGLSMTDQNFAEIVAKPDNVPIVGLVFLLAFFTWLATHRAVINDERRKQGLDSLEKLDSDKVLVWPDLVYSELICMVGLTAFLLIWALLLKAPLEEFASPVKTPNPSKAPWYFLGLQEMLVYYDPWMAGVVLPVTVIAGLMAIPYLDFNKKGNGYYTIEERQFAYLTFQFGFLVLWITLIVMGTFLRGPNWNFFGPFEKWDAHKVEVQNNKDLADFFWIDLLGSSRPRAPEGSTELVKLSYSLLRESPGILLLLGYFAVLPPLLVVAIPFVQELFKKMGFIRYMVLANLFLTMMLLPIKMFFRWTITLKYFISLPEYLLNF